MAMAELNEHITVSLFTWCLRTGLTMSDGEYFDHVYLLNACRGFEKKWISTLFGKMFRNFPNRQTTGPVGDYLHGATAPVHVRSQEIDQKK